MAVPLSGSEEWRRCVCFIQIAQDLSYDCKHFLFVGAFLIPYFVMLAVEGIPIFYLELAIGQRLRKGAIGVWNQVNRIKNPLQTN